jgi:hypothetical protein
MDYRMIVFSHKFSLRGYLTKYDCSSGMLSVLKYDQVV